jgi:SP family myo-inositol transporter-like MFS transporter 13
MFLSVVYPGLLFFLGSFTLSETPRWLFRQGKKAEALASLRRSSSERDAERQLTEMEMLSAESAAEHQATNSDSLLRRKYVVPFVLACVILACNQATGINSVLQFMVVMLKQAGMTAARATQGNIAVTVLNAVMTLVAVALVDKKGRVFLLKLGTSGIIVALLACAAVFYSFESKRVDAKPQVIAAQDGNQLHLASASAITGSAHPSALTVIYSYGDGDKSITAISTDADSSIILAPDPARLNAPLTIRKAFYGPIPTERTGWLVMACLSLFIAAFAVGPGVVVWLALSELMPTRIRSTGMGIALLLNQGVSTAIAGLFLPVVGVYGYYAMFLFWAACTVIYFLTAAFFLPETKDKSLEEIEHHFERRAVLDR